MKIFLHKLSSSEQIFIYVEDIFGYSVGLGGF